MQAAFDPISLKPPRPGRWSMPMVLALAAHLLLIAALTWGVHWKQDAQPQTFEAELWSAVAQKAAPREVVPPPPPPPKVEPKVVPKVEPKPTPPEPKPKAAPPDTREADIAVAQAKKKKEEAEKREAEKKAAKEKADKEKADKLEKDKKAKELEKEKQKKQAAEEAKQKKALDDKFKQLEDKKNKAAAEKADNAAAKAREDQMRRIMGQAGATGDASAKGTAQRDSGPSAGYAGRVRARIKPNVLFTDDIAGNPKAEVEVTTAPDGTIMSRRLAKSSGNPDWDKAALAAIDRTGTLPRDVDGRVPSPMIVELRPRD